MKRYLRCIRLGLCRLSTILAAASIALMAILMISEVALRHFFGSPLGWNVNFIQNYLMTSLIFLGLSYTYRSHAHVTVDLLYDRSGPTMRRVMSLLGYAIVLITLSLIIWSSALATLDAWKLHEIPPPGGADLSWPSWTWRILIPIGASLMWLEVLNRLLRDLTDEPEEPSPSTEVHP